MFKLLDFLEYDSYLLVHSREHGANIVGYQRHALNHTACVYVISYRKCSQSAGPLVVTVSVCGSHTVARSKTEAAQDPRSTQRTVANATSTVLLLRDGKLFGTVPKQRKPPVVMDHWSDGFVFGGTFCVKLSRARVSVSVVIVTRHTVKSSRKHILIT